MQGTTSRLSSVEVAMPPMISVAMAVYSSEPGSSPSASGIMPRIIAS